MHVEHDESQKRFYTTIDGMVARLEYGVAGPDTLEYYSTFVPPELRGQGVARRLAKEALDYALARQKRVIPSCWFVQKVMDEERVYDPLRIES
jgi:hypothetical protein